MEKPKSTQKNKSRLCLVVLSMILIIYLMYQGGHKLITTEKDEIEFTNGSSHFKVKHKPNKLNDETIKATQDLLDSLSSYLNNETKTSRPNQLSISQLSFYKKVRKIYNPDKATWFETFKLASQVYNKVSSLNQKYNHRYNPNLYISNISNEFNISNQDVQDFTITSKPKSVNDWALFVYKYIDK